MVFGIRNLKMATPTGVQKINTERLAIGAAAKGQDYLKLAQIYLRADDNNVQALRTKWPTIEIPFKPLANSTDGSFPLVDRVRCLAKAGALIAAAIDQALIP